MDKAFSLSLLYLLLIIPQHGNSPIPRIESWMEMDQGDSFVDRDLTSSFTGAENFGSAHKNYQNALIRKDHANSEDDLLHERAIGKFSGNFPERMQKRVAINPNFMPNQYDGYGYDNFAGDSVLNRLICQGPISGINGYHGRRCGTDLSSGNGHASYSRFRSRFYDSAPDELVDQPLPTVDATSVQSDNENLEEGKAIPFSRRTAKCSPGETDATAVALGIREEGADESEETSNRMKNRLNEDYLTEISIGDGDERDLDLLRYNRDGKEDFDADVSDDYSDTRNPVSARDDTPDDSDVEYGQINPERIINKREEGKTRNENSVVDGEEISDAFLRGDAKVKSSKGSNSKNLLAAEAPKVGREITKDFGEGSLQGTDAARTMKSNLESKVDVNALRNSRRTSEEMRISRRKSEATPKDYHENLEWKQDGYGTEMEKRNKREDEDEQKNMKTGTDEGGGEYEDEEGKGHNDEEDYYEEGEISTGDITADTLFTHHPSHRNLYKRETGKDGAEIGIKEHEGNVDVSVEDYQLNLENAPVEHEDSSKKCSWREGRSREKSVARRGMKIWDEWGKWSPCSVTCGVGRKTRWRHCIGGGCARGEKEALIKKCTYPACR